MRRIAREILLAGTFLAVFIAPGAPRAHARVFRAGTPIGSVPGCAAPSHVLLASAPASTTPVSASPVSTPPASNVSLSSVDRVNGVRLAGPTDGPSDQLYVDWVSPLQQAQTPENFTLAPQSADSAPGVGESPAVGASPGVGTAPGTPVAGASRRASSGTVRVPGATAIPEPGTLLLMGTGLLPLAAWACRRRHHGRLL